MFGYTFGRGKIENWFRRNRRIDFGMFDLKLILAVKLIFTNILLLIIDTLLSTHFSRNQFCLIKINFSHTVEPNTYAKHIYEMRW